ncbi:MAG: hypothetical protein WAO09_01880 [Candidatus Dormiibacterota bacterium]
MTEQALPIDDPRRPLIRRGVFGTLWATAIFFVFTATKEVKPIYNHAPWLNDPYDAVISLTMFFVPLLAACVLVQLELCLRSEPLSTHRVLAILRESRLAIGAIIFDLLSAWVAVVLGANRSQWTTGATGVEVGLLVIASFAATKAAIDLSRVPRLLIPSRGQQLPMSDWLEDAITVARRESRWLGPVRGVAVHAVDWADDTIARRIRRHPVVAAAIASGIFGLMVFGWQGYREGYFVAVTLLAMGLGFCGMFAFLVPAGSYVGLVRSANPLRGLQRRTLDASVIACGSAMITLAFRNSLWGLAGINANTAGVAQLATLVGSGTLLTFVSVLVVESLLRFHSRRAH